MRGRPPKYNWDEWLIPGELVVLTKDEDFDCSIAGMRAQAYHAAEVRGGRASVAIHGQTLHIVFLAD